MTAGLDVSKVIPVALDLGNLAAFDVNPVEEALLQDPAGREAYLQTLTRDNMQLLVNQLFRLESTPSDVGAILALPEPTTPLPRAKPVPVPKPPTRWEKFAQIKGITKRQTSQVYDEGRQEWRPRYGPRSSKNDPMNDWVTELKPGQSIDDL